MSAPEGRADVSLSGVMDEDRKAVRTAGSLLPPRMPALLVALTAVTGVIEAVSLLALGPAFTAMQTGNVLFLAFGAAQAGDLPTLPAGISLAAFVLGVVCGSHVEAVLEARGRRWFVLGLVLEAGLILAAAALAWGLAPQYGSPTPRHLAVTAVLALAMGLRNTTIMRANVPGVPTTLVTRSMTAFLGGSAMGRDAVYGYGSAGWKLRGLSIVAMFAGGFVGALLIRAGWTVGWLLVPAAATVLVVGLVYRGQPPLHTGSAGGRERSQ
ncbi:MULTISPECIES: YoaK family protein [Streptomyces]|uniref:YoaK family protein n=1 Tax=Streptomyces TaxID=1883 RepID=UPI000D1BDD67|nr:MULTISPECIES: YoaK family protein [Streptomyces]MDX6759371.1 YoaK family protein [Streptomyces sp. F8]